MPLTAGFTCVSLSGEVAGRKVVVILLLVEVDHDGVTCQALATFQSSHKNMSACELNSRGRDTLIQDILMYGGAVVVLPYHVEGESAKERLQYLCR